MIIVFKKNISNEDYCSVKSFILKFEDKIKFWKKDDRSFVAILNQNHNINIRELNDFACIEKIIEINKNYKQIASEIPMKPIQIKNQIIKKNSFNIIAGPCTIKSYSELKEIVIKLKEMGLYFFRGGAFKLRTSPYSFSGLGSKGLEYIKRVSEETNMISVSEVVCSEDVKAVSENVDIIVVGTRNMYNYRLLKKLGGVDNPIILKRGMSATLDEWLLAAEYLANNGNEKIILCERGIRTFTKYTRNTLDISAVPLIKSLSNLPIIVDPSHSTGVRNIIKDVSLAAVASGADGLMIEAHINPDDSICDSKQTIDIETLSEIIKKQKTISEILDYE